MFLLHTIFSPERLLLHSFLHFTSVLIFNSLSVENIQNKRKDPELDAKAVSTKSKHSLSSADVNFLLFEV